MPPPVSAPPSAQRQGGLFSQGAANAYLMLTFTSVCWGGNAVAGRLIVGEISPMVVTCLRWAIVAAIMAAIGLRGFPQAVPELKRNWKRILWMAACGFSFFNALFYLSAHYTTAVNISILQGSIPVFVVLGAMILQGTRLSGWQIVGIAATLVGVALVATRGHLATIASLGFNQGDALMLLACLLYAAYTLALRDRPKVPALAFFLALAAIAFLTSLPLVAIEMAQGRAQWPTPKGWLVMIFIAVFPSFLAQLSFMRGVRLIGPGRAGIFANLVPIFGALFAVIILGEPFALYHLAALVLVIGGILIAEASGRRLANRNSGPAA